jgi:signal transduction histidine kinase
MREKLTKVTGCLLVPLLCAAFFFFFPCRVAQGEATGRKRVLVLNSYHKGLSWTDNVVTGIESVLGGARGIELSLEYMDTKKHHDSRYLHKLYELYRLKYGSDRPDLVIVSDNDAFDFIREYNDRLFPATPVVFCGINDYRDSMVEGHRLFTGVIEETDVKETIEIALKLHPSAGWITVVGDKSSAALAMQHEVLSAVPFFRDSVQFAFIEDFDAEELRRQIREVPEDGIILMTVVSKDREGNYYSFEESLDLVYREAKVPIYSFWDIYLGRGVVGGMLTSGVEQGRQAARLAVRILQGEDAGSIPVVRKSPNRYMFDYRELERFGIARSSLPFGSVVVNEPDAHFFRLRTVMAVSGAIIALLLTAVVTLAVRARVLAERRRIEELKRSREDLRNLSAYLDAAREEERKNIAREIHDELGISLTTLKLGLSWLKSYLLDSRNPPDIELLVAKTQAMSEDTKATIQAVQRISSELRPGVLDNLGLPAAIEWQAGEFRERTGIECKTVIDEDTTLDQNRSIAVYRIFQETLTNIMRYSEATQVGIILKRRDGMLVLEVRDNGRGITEEQIRNPRSFGIIGMRERAHFLGGSVDIGRSPEGGTTVVVTIPVTGRESREVQSRKPSAAGERPGGDCTA